MARTRKKTITLCLLGDVLIITYLWLTLSNKEFLGKIAKVAAKEKGLEHLDPFYLQQIIQVALQSLKFMLVLMALLHIIIYFAYFYGKTYAKTYIKSYAFLGAAGSLLSVMSYLINLDFMWSAYFLALTVLFSYMGLTLIKNQEQ